MELEPVFITGCGRSGTTMLGGHLANLPGFFALPEMQFVHDLLLVADDGPEAVFTSLSNDFRFRVLGTHIDLADFSDAWKNGAQRAIDLIIAKYFEARKITRPLTRWVEHSPESRDHLHLLRSAFPTAKFIHILRDPRATFLSMRSLPRWHMKDPMHFAIYWGDAVGKCHRFAARHPADMIEIRYEDLLANPRKTFGGICAFLNVPYDEAVLCGGGILLPKFTEGQHSLVNGPIVPSKATEWEERLPAREAELIERSLSDWMIHYGYASGPRRIPKATGLEKAAYKLLELISRPYSMALDFKVKRLLH